MTENEYIIELKALWPRECETSLDTISLVDEAVLAFPLSSQLWCMRGNLILLGSESCPHSLEDALASYKRAIEVDPQFAEAWKEVGYFYFNVLDDETTAQPYFHEFERLKGNAQQSRCTEPGDDVENSKRCNILGYHAGQIELFGGRRRCPFKNRSPAPSS